VKVPAGEEGQTQIAPQNLQLHIEEDHRPKREREKVRGGGGSAREGGREGGRERKEGRGGGWREGVSRRGGGRPPLSKGTERIHANKPRKEGWKRMPACVRCAPVCTRAREMEREMEREKAGGRGA
jgi:hypothetical protein